jgi:2-phosphosulfolactate phosphatase
MKIDAILTPSELPALARRDLRETLCVVFDVLRATSTFVTALNNGAKAIIPVSEISEALAFKKAASGKRQAETILLGGERDGVKIRAAQTGGIDFDLGNSPRECMPEKVRGKTIVSTTTNGTRALRACASAKTVLAGSFLNLGATVAFIKKLQPAEVLLVCAGTREDRADEDVLAAGALCDLLGVLGLECGDMSPLSKVPTCRRTPQLSDSAEIARHYYSQAKSDLAAAVCNATNARRLLAIPELRDDVAFCLQRDAFPLVAKMEADGAIRRQPER